jgi:hypothetical protein
LTYVESSLDGGFGAGGGREPVCLLHSPKWLVALCPRPSNFAVGALKALNHISTIARAPFISDKVQSRHPHDYTLAVMDLPDILSDCQTDFIHLGCNLASGATDQHRSFAIPPW